MGGALIWGFPRPTATILKAALCAHLSEMILGLVILRAVRFEIPRETLASISVLESDVRHLQLWVAAGLSGHLLGTVLSASPPMPLGHFTGLRWIWVNPSSLLVAITLIRLTF